MDLHKKFINELYIFITGRTVAPKNCQLIKKYSEKCSTLGDFSFSVDFKIWKIHLNNNEESGSEFYYNFLKESDFWINVLIEKSRDWEFLIQSVKIIAKRCVVCLDRFFVYRKYMKTCLDDEKTVISGSSDCFKVTRDDNEKCNSVKNHRIKLIGETIQNCLKYLEPKSDFKEKTVYVTYKTSHQTELSSDIIINCASVTDPKNGSKSSLMLAEDYIK